MKLGKGRVCAAEHYNVPRGIGSGVFFSRREGAEERNTRGGKIRRLSCGRGLSSMFQKGCRLSTILQVTVSCGDFKEGK